ncbi:hypothetical protein ACHAWF_015011 [Thalassiosira exigua]
MLPVIIAGAGPCGLVAALTLQKHGVPFVIYEKAAAEKLCSNAGSGIDMAPTALSILENELDLGEGLDRSMRPYEYMHLADMKGNFLTRYDLRGMKVASSRSFGFASRATLQHALLDKLGLRDVESGAIKREAVNGGELHCSMAIEEYRQEGGIVEVTLSDGTASRGCALLGCDGIHSGVRKHMNRGKDDPFHYCGHDALWGKTIVKAGSDLDKELKRIAAKHKMEDGHISFTSGFDKTRPGFFFTVETAPLQHAWVFGVRNQSPPAADLSNDLVRRGGVRLTGDSKQKEIDRVLTPKHDALVRTVMTQSEDITRAGLFDRENLDLPYVDGLVALLGDAAHPQSPMMGQGANMGICDGYVAATRIAAAIEQSEGTTSGDLPTNIHKALADYDCKNRRKENNKVIKKARFYGNWSMSTNRFSVRALKVVTKYAPSSMVLGEIIKGDKSNKKFVAKLRSDFIG